MRIIFPQKHGWNLKKPNVITADYLPIWARSFVPRFAAPCRAYKDGLSLLRQKAMKYDDCYAVASRTNYWVDRISPQ
jgi:hypothetical protein